MFEFYSFTCSCLIFPTPLTEETAFYLLYILASFIEDQLTINAWVYLGASYLVPLIYMFVSVPLPYCFDYHSFVVDLQPHSAVVKKMFDMISVFLNLPRLSLWLSM